jgi:hypothetical protein
LRAEAAVICTAEEWEEHGDAVCATYPIRLVVFTNYTPPMESDDAELRGESLVYPFHVAWKRVNVSEAEFVAASRAGVPELVRCILSARWPPVPRAGWSFPRITPFD